MKQFETWATSTPTATKRFNHDGALAASAYEHFKDVVNNPSEIVFVEGLKAEWLGLLAKARCKFHTIATRVLEDDSLRDSSFELTGIDAHNVQISANLRVVIRDCRIGRLHCDSWANIELIDTWVSDMTIGGLFHFRWTNGYLGKGSFDQNNIRGDVRITQLYLNKSRALHGTQWLRQARAAFIENHNLLAASAFHATELIHDRAEQPPAAQVVSWAYQIGSSFGGSIGRAAFWILAAFLSVVLIGTLGGTQAISDGGIGWHQRLLETDIVTQLVRSGLYALNCIFNPLNLIVSKPLVTATSWAGAVTCSVVGLTGTTAFALLLLGPVLN